MARATAHIGQTRYATTVTAAGRELISDEPAGNGCQDAGAEFIDRQVAFTGSLDDAQVKRLLEVCERTPVTKTLKQGLTITTTLKSG